MPPCISTWATPAHGRLRPVALRIFEPSKHFSSFHIEQAMGFRTYLEHSKTNAGKPLGKSTMRSVLSTLREFILWLSQQDGFRSRIRASDADYFNLSRRDEAEARAAPPRPAPSINQAKRALGLMPSATPQQKRDKAVFALLCLTGVRVAALVSLKIKHVDLQEQSVTQNPREVATKFGKAIDTKLFDWRLKRRAFQTTGRTPFATCWPAMRQDTAHL